ncbi:MAG: hypothetical protein ACOCWA_09555 [Bacteroidota bacterium]
MKKICVLSLVFVLSLFSVKLSAQEDQADKMSYKDQNLFGVGISLGYYSYGYLGSRSIGIPPLSAYYETGIHDYITAGPFLGVARWSYRYSTNDYRYSWTFINVGARGSFHITGFMNEILGLEIDEEKIDWYLTLLAGMEFRNYSSNTGFDENTYSNTSRFFIGPSTGVRYYLSDSFAIFAEGGYGALGAFTLGASFKL